MTCIYSALFQFQPVGKVAKCMYRPLIVTHTLCVCVCVCIFKCAFIVCLLHREVPTTRKQRINVIRHRSPAHSHWGEGPVW